MKPGLPLSECTSCETSYFPFRLICPKCGNADWRDSSVAGGVLEQMTTVRHAAGKDNWEPRYIGCVRTSKGQMINVGLEEPLPDQTKVLLFDREGSPIARKAD